MSDIASAVIEACAGRLLKEYPNQVRASLSALSDDQIWWRANPSCNSVGNLVLHVCGSTRHFLGRAVGGSDYKRDRPAEFAEQGPIARAELRRILDETIAEAQGIVAGLSGERLLQVTDRGGEPSTVVALLLRVSQHWAVHAGQIVYATKTLAPEAFAREGKALRA